MKKAMLEFDVRKRVFLLIISTGFPLFQIDINRMPLGKLSKKQIDITYSILKQLQDLLIESETSKNKLLELSNKFYTTMPHNFGMRKPPLIDTLEMVKEKCEMIESLMEMEVAYKLMRVGTDTGPSIDGQYEKLHNRIEPMDKSCDEYRRLETYLANTHAPSHGGYKIKVLDIYDVARDGELDRFRPFETFSNRMMLWHGSRRTNWAGIL